MRYRFEYKYLVSEYTAALLKTKIAAIMNLDSHSNGNYVVNNLYLDDRFDSFYHAKHVGQLHRDKYRFRYYNDDLSFIRLERKHKDGIMSYKETMPVSLEQYTQVKSGDLSFIHTEDAPLWKKLSLLHNLRGLRSAAFFSYRREAYIYEPGDIRFTFDSPLFDSKNNTIAGYDHLSCVYGEQEYYPLLLEIKYSGFMPELIKRMLNGLPLAHVSVSKYCIARERGILPYGKI